MFIICKRYVKSSKAGVLSQAMMWPHKGLLKTSEDIFHCHKWGGGGACCWHLEAKGVAKHLTTHTAAPPTTETQPHVSVVQKLRNPAPKASDGPTNRCTCNLKVITIGAEPPVKPAYLGGGGTGL